MNLGQLEYNILVPTSTKRTQTELIVSFLADFQVKNTSSKSSYIRHLYRRLKGVYDRIL